MTSHDLGHSRHVPRRRRNVNRPHFPRQPLPRPALRPGEHNRPSLAKVARQALQKIERRVGVRGDKLQRNDARRRGHHLLPAVTEVPRLDQPAGKVVELPPQSEGPNASPLADNYVSGLPRR